MDKSLIDYLKQIPDHRDPYGLRHPLWLVLLMIIMGIMSGYWGYRQLGRIGSRHRRELISRLKIPKARVPSYSVMRRVMVDLDYKELQKIFNQWSIESSLIPASEWISVDALHCQKADATPRRRQAQTPVPSSRRQSLQRGEPPFGFMSCSWGKPPRPHSFTATRCLGNPFSICSWGKPPPREWNKLWLVLEWGKPQHFLSQRPQCFTNGLARERAPSKTLAAYAKIRQ